MKLRYDDAAARPRCTLQLAVRAALAAALAAAVPATAHAEGPADASGGVDTLAEITVFGRGETRQVSALSAAELGQAAPGTSPLKAIDKLPGVSFQSADPFGAYEWSTRISIRGFNQNQLGFTLDGVPLGDMSYGNHNGLHVSRAIASENVARVVLSQGAGALGTPSTSNLGGTLEFYSADPEPEFGARGAVTGGSDSTFRVHARLDTGAFGPGTRAYLSYTDQNADKWKGAGEQKQRQVNFKVVQPFGDAALTAFYNWSDRAENDYQDLSRALIERNGYDWDNVTGDWALAVRVAQIAGNVPGTGVPTTNPAAGTVFPAPFQTVDDAYYDASGLRKDHLAGVTLEAPLGGAASLATTAYLHRNDGQGVWFTPYVPTPGGAPISVRTTEYDIDRRGATARLSWKLGAHELAGGAWYEDNEFGNARRFYGLGLDAPGRDSLEFMRDPFFTQWQYAFDTTTKQFWLQDVWSPTESLKLSFGFKSVEVESESRTVVGTFPSGSIEAKDSFLPQVGVNWRVAGDHELFASYAENMRAYVAAGTAGPFSTTPGGFAEIRDTLEPETSRTVEVGWRYSAGPIQALATLYDVKFEDRLLSVTVGSPIQGNFSALQNVGSVVTRGLETGLAWEFAPNFRLYGSYTYNDSEYDDDVVTATGRTALKGRQTVDTPKSLAKLEVGYDDSRLYARLGASYVAKRYYTYTNDAGVPSYTLVDVSGGYRFGNLGFLRDLAAQVNVTNALDEEYVSTIGSGGFVNSDPGGTAQTLLSGAPRQVFFTLTGRF